MQRSLDLRRVLPAVAVVALAVPAAGAGNDAPRTPGGRPDLSGNYDISTLTPWQRPEDFGDRRAHTPEEVARLQGRAAEGDRRQWEASEPDREAPPVGGNVGGYNRFYLDLGTSPVRVGDEYRTSLITDPPNGRLPPLTERGAARRDGMYSFWGENSGEAWWLGEEVGPYDGPESMSIADRCIFHLEATVPAVPRAYNNVKTIVQTDDHVMLLTEWMHTARVVRLVDDPSAAVHLPPEIRSRAGDSIGWWEGDTLVVETTNFLEESWVTFSVGGNASPAHDQRVVERFTRLDGGDLLYQFSVESSDFTTPFSGEYTWPRTGERLWEYACHEGNYALGNILRGARLLEAEAE
ncbi:MAG: hypothetical protein R3190_01965 [Thermoanaerobaculia bacterium]|nr:hypothetical protein [Thermoanaerobaculia bacterium]